MDSAPAHGLLDSPRAALDEALHEVRWLCPALRVRCAVVWESGRLTFLGSSQPAALASLGGTR